MSQCRSRTLSPDSQGTPPQRITILGKAALIVLASCVAYLPALRGGFILDDHQYLTANPLIKASDGLYRFWLTAEPIDYYPLSNTTLWLEWRLWGTKPTGYHVTNLLLHVATALLLWSLLQKLSIPGAFLAAILFTLHPVNVESVAWIAQRKDLLAVLFFLLSIFWYLKADRPSALSDHSPHPERTADLQPRGAARWYWLSLLAFVLAMLSKGSVAILPLVLLLIVWWRRPLTKSDLLRTAPFWVAAAILTAINIWCQSRLSYQPFRSAGCAQRLVGAGAVVWFYLSKALLPIGLVFIYPNWIIQLANPLWWLPLSAALTTTAALWWWRKRRWGRPLFFAWAIFCVTLVPFLGFIDVGFMQFSLVADHYQHIAIISVMAVLAAGWARCRNCLTGPARTIHVALTAVLVTALGILTWQQCRLYDDALTMYQATLAKNPNSWLMHNDLGIEFLLVGRSQEAIAQLQQALRLKPDYAEAHRNLGNLLMDTGRPWEAIEQYQQALRLNPNSADYHNRLGFALDAVGRSQDSREHFQQALRLKPDDAEAHHNLGVALAKAGQTHDAVDHFQQALRLKPDYADAHFNLGNLLMNSGLSQAAIEQYQQALQTKPDFAAARGNLAVALTAAGKTQEAVAEFTKILRLHPNNVQAHFNLAEIYAQLKQPSEAIDAAEKALQSARSAGQTDLAQQIADWLSSYRASQSRPFNGPTPANAPAPNP